MCVKVIIILGWANDDKIFSSSRTAPPLGAASAPARLCDQVHLPAPNYPIHEMPTLVHEMPTLVHFAAPRLD